MEKSDTTKKKLNLENENDEDLTSKLRKNIGEKLTGAFGRDFVWKLTKDKSIEYYYEDNLRRVMKAVSNLISNLDGKIIITADHGECFGEEGYWGHGYYRGGKIPRIPALIEIPWLEVAK